MTATVLFPNTFWNKPLGPNRVVIADANNYAQKLANQATRSKTTSPAGWYDQNYQAISVDYTSSVPIYRVPQGAPKYPITWWEGNPAKAAGMADQSGLQSYFQQVPIPMERGANLGAAGNDKPWVVIEDGTGRCWEAWEGTVDPVNLRGGMSFGGYIPNIFNHPGVMPWGWGVSASGLPLVAGMIRMQEFRDYLATGVAPCHPIRIQVADTTGTHIAPAVRNDGGGPKLANTTGSNVDAVPEGLWVALPSDYVVPAGLTPFQTMTQTMARDNGMIVCDATGGSVNIVIEDHHTQGTGYCEVPDLLGVAYPQAGFWDPYHAADGGATNPWMAFPWSALQQVAPPV